MKKIENAHVIPYYDRKGEIEALQPLEECSVVTSIGNLTPIYQVDDQKYTNQVILFPNLIFDCE